MQLSLEERIRFIYSACRERAVHFPRRLSQEDPQLILHCSRHTDGDSYRIRLHILRHKSSGHPLMDVIEGVSTEFITGNDPNLACIKLSGGRGYGKVHSVRYPVLISTSTDIRCS